MKFGDLLRMLGPCGWFDLATVTQLSGEPRATVCTQLHRWSKGGKPLPLRRGMYAIAEEYRRVRIQPAELANRIYAPSYLSLHWALGYYGMIPERVVRFTSVTSRQTKRFENAFGSFHYRHLKPAAFFAYRKVVMDGHGIFMAEPEKALLDLWYFETGRWGADRMREMRFQNFEMVDPARLVDHANRFASSRLHAAVRVWLDLAELETGGLVEL